MQTTSFVLRNGHIADYKGTYCRLIEPTTQQGKEEMFLSGENRYTAQQSNFSKIPGSPVAYWASNNIISSFDEDLMAKKFADFRHGMSTSDNNRFLRYWHEVSIENIGFFAKSKADTFIKKWYIYLKGGTYRKWYGNYDYVVNWKCDGEEIKAISNEKYPYLKGNLDFVLGGQMYFFKPGYTWSSLTSGNLGMRKFTKGCIFDAKGQCYFIQNNEIGDYMLGFYNSAVFSIYGKILSPTLDYNSGVISKAPIILKEKDQVKEVDSKVNENVVLAQFDWDSYETSWDFQRHPLIRSIPRLADAYTSWKAECEQRFLQLKANEEELNRIFIDIYGLQGELTPEVADKDVTVHRVFDTKDDVPESMQGSNYVRAKRDEIVSLLSYAVGCMFGRYSLDVDGLAYAGGEWDAGKYKTFLPDHDDVIPITDEEYLEDDIISRLCDWLKAAYGADTLEENLDFIAGALGGKGNSSREIIRNYFLKDFFKDHCKTYQKRPIYWLFDSGKQNGFKALIYLHRYTPDTIGNLRVDYLHKMQRVYESEINRMQDMIDHSTNAREVAASTKRKEKLQKQLKECRDYDEMIAHLALSRIELDLDDGVKVNYEKIQTASDGKKYAVLAKI